MAGIMRRVKTHRMIVVALLSLIATGCGSSDSASRPAPKPKPQPSQKDKRHARAVLHFYRATGNDKRYLIKRVRVLRGTVTVDTKLFPKVENNRYLVGACNQLVGFGRWEKAIDVYGDDREDGAHWTKGDVGCE